MMLDRNIITLKLIILTVLGIALSVVKCGEVKSKVGYGYTRVTDGYQRNDRYKGHEKRKCDLRRHLFATGKEMCNGEGTDGCCKSDEICKCSGRVSFRSTSLLCTGAAYCKPKKPTAESQTGCTFPTLSADVLQEARKHFVKIDKVCSLRELYDCVEETIKIPKNPECISAMQEITSFFGRVRDKQPLMCNVTKVMKQQNEKLKNVCNASTAVVKVRGRNAVDRFGAGVAVCAVTCSAAMLLLTGALTLTLGPVGTFGGLAITGSSAAIGICGACGITSLVATIG